MCHHDIWAEFELQAAKKSLLPSGLACFVCLPGQTGRLSFLLAIFGSSSAPWEGRLLTFEDTSYTKGWGFHTARNLHSLSRLNTDKNFFFFFS